MIKEIITNATGKEMLQYLSSINEKIYEKVNYGNSDFVCDIISKQITNIDYDLATNIHKRLCSDCKNLTNVDMTLVTSIESEAFYGCNNLTTASFGRINSMGSGVFEGCSKLKSFSHIPGSLSTLPSRTFFNCSELSNFSLFGISTIGTSAFSGCISIPKIEMSSVTSINSSAFNNCTGLVAVVIRKTDTVCALSNSNAFNGTPIAKGTGYIYVPDALVDQYKSATNWSVYANQIKPLSEYV